MSLGRIDRTGLTVVSGGGNPDQRAEQNQTTCGERFRRIEGLREALRGAVPCPERPASGKPVFDGTLARLRRAR